MSQLEQFSVYNNLLTRPSSLDNPLQDLLPDDCDHGWHVARNLIKPLNHLDFLRRKEEIAVELNLHNLLTPPLWFNVNYATLTKHQARQISTADVIKHLAGQLYQGGDPLSEAEVDPIHWTTKRQK